MLCILLVLFCLAIISDSKYLNHDDEVLLSVTGRIRKSRKRLERNFKKISKQRRRRRFSKGFFIRSGVGAIFRTRLFRRFAHRCGRQSYRFRRIDGSCNHWKFAKRGAAGTGFHLTTNRGRGPRSRRPTGRNRPSARVISNLVHNDVKSKANKRKMSEMVVFFGYVIYSRTLSTTPLTVFQLADSS